MAAPSALSRTPREMSAEAVVRLFVEAINEGDLERLSALMTEDHLFKDSDGSEVRGRQDVVAAWTAFFSAVRAYKVCVQEVFRARHIVVIVGTAEGFCASSSACARESRWCVPAAWRAVVHAGRVAVWQVFVNPDPILEAMRESGEDPRGGEKPCQV